MSRKVILLFVVGVTLVLTGIFIGRSSNDNLVKNNNGRSLSERPVLGDPSSPSSSGILRTSKSSPLVKTEVIISRVLDGDTVETSLGERIRYLGINSPEKGQPFSSGATKANEALVLDKKVRLEFDIQSKDRYGRTLAYVFAGDTLVNLEMVKKGLAVTETIQPNVKYQDEIVGAQKQARDNCLGLWKDLCSQKSDNVLGNTSFGCIKIVSINADAPGNDNQNKNGEWIEIKSSCSLSVSMDGWSLKDSSASNRYGFKNFSLDSGKNVLLYSGCGQNSSDKLYWLCPEGKYAIWNNSGDHAFLYNEKGELVSDYQY